jgi:hypothetical protein
MLPNFKAYFQFNPDIFLKLTFYQDFGDVSLFFYFPDDFILKIAKKREIYVAKSE